jgi:hypothetical protein
MNHRGRRRGLDTAHYKKYAALGETPAFPGAAFHEDRNRWTAYEARMRTFCLAEGLHLQTTLHEGI